MVEALKTSSLEFSVFFAFGMFEMQHFYNVFGIESL